MLLSEATQDYLAYARHERGHTTATYYSYQSRLHNFARWLADENGLVDPRVQEVSASLLGRYVYHLSARNLRPRTIRGALQAIRALFAYPMEMGGLSVNPAMEVRLPKRDAATRLTPAT